MTTDGPGDPLRVSRRRVLLGAGALAGSATVGLASAGAAHAGGPPAAWPTRGLGARDAGTVDASQFLPVAQLKAWHEQLDSMGMRATGAGARAVRGPAGEPIEAGRGEARPYRTGPPRPVVRDALVARRHGAIGSRPDRHRLLHPLFRGHTTGRCRGAPGHRAGGPDAGPGFTGREGRGAEGAGDIDSTLDDGVDCYGTYDPHHLIDPAGQYSRPWTGITGLISLLDALPASGAVGAVAVIDLPAAGAHGSYYPYDGTIRTTPGVFVDGPTGRHLEGLATSNASVRLTLDSTTERMVSRNVVGVIEGRSPQTVILNSHTDGPNAVEDNGPNTIVAMCQYLTRLPKASLPRTLVVSLTTGHFYGGIGQKTFAADHRDSTLRQAVCGVTLEHLGALEWDSQPDGTMALTGRHELGAMFVPENRALVDASLAAIRRAGAGPALVLRPYVPAPGSPNGFGWPGEGTQLWTDGHLPTVNYITGPTYLLNWGIPTTNKCDFVRMRRQAVSFTQMALDLSRVPSQSLATRDLPGL